MALPNIYIVACGGTIAGKAATEEDLTGYTAGAATIDEVLQAVPAVHQYARIRGEQFCSIDSSDMSEGLWLALAARVQELAGRDDVDGIVVTHGTDTMEETAYFLNLAVHTEKPVVFVGSMRPATAISADGPLNLLEAVQAAAQAETGRYGVVIVMNGTICSARFVEKTDTTHVDTFKSRSSRSSVSPAPRTFAVFAPVADKARHVPQGVAQEQANLVGEAPLLPQPGLQPGQGFLRLKGAVAVPGQEVSGAGLVQVLLEPGGPEQVQQGPIPLAPQHPQGEPLSPERRVPLGHLGFQAARVFQGDAEHAGRLDARQGGGAVFHQAALQREGRCDAAPPQAGRCPFCPRAGHGA